MSFVSENFITLNFIMSVMLAVGDKKDYSVWKLPILPSGYRQAFIEICNSILKCKGNYRFQLWEIFGNQNENVKWIQLHGCNSS